MKEKRFRVATVKLGQASFGEAPKRFDAVDMRLAASKFILAMEHTIMIITIQNQAIVGRPTIGVDRAAFEDLPRNYRHQKHLWNNSAQRSQTLCLHA